jgi:hypothetical protein
MPEMGPSGLLSGDGKRGGAQASVLASILDSTHTGTQFVLLDDISLLGGGNLAIRANVSVAAQ